MVPLRFVFDEHLRGPLWNLLARNNRNGDLAVDVVRVGDAGTVPLGTKDPELLRWAEKEGRILVSEDRRTMSTHLADHLRAGHHSPGVMTLKEHVRLRVVVEFLVLAAYATDPEEWADANHFIP
jgi:Domain of unknown function (DUF5615)